ncbi:hypothetical protein PUN28_000900 [Cardiocondyla obscurior]|uniref:Uncharacterized protein n=1 Tax=Cardiocondyla obscurior TaxID=286306 RepID=A0AAW2H1P9_9HYME
MPPVNVVKFTFTGGDTWTASSSISFSFSYVTIRAFRSCSFGYQTSACWSSDRFPAVSNNNHNYFNTFRFSGICIIHRINVIINL